MQLPHGVTIGAVESLVGNGICFLQTASCATRILKQTSLACRRSGLPCRALPCPCIMSCDERQRQRQGISIKHWLLQMRIIRFMRTRRFALPVWVRRELPPLVGNLGCATAAPPLPSFAQGAAPVPLREPAPGMPGGSGTSFHAHPMAGRSAGAGHKPACHHPGGVAGCSSREPG